MFQKKAVLLFLVILPFIIGSSNLIKPDIEQFTLNNNSVFSPGTQVSVSIYSSNRVETEYKVTLLKINDVEGFYSGLLTSNYNFDIVGKEILFKYTQKVKEWSASVKPNPSYGSGNLPLGKIDEPGIYIVQALKGNLVAYCPVVVTDFSILYKTSPSSILAFVENVRSGEFIKKTSFKFISNADRASAESDESGIAIINVKPSTERMFSRKSLLIAKTGKEVLISNPYFYFGRERDIVGYTYTSQPIYRPGQHVFFKSIIRLKKGNELKDLNGETFNVVIRTPDNKEVFNKDLTTNETGTIWGDFLLDEDAALGNYSIYIKQGGTSIWGSFSVEEYKKPEYEVLVNIPKPNYSNHDVIEGKVNANYYFGSPVSKGTVSVRIYRQYYWRPWWYFSDYSWFYGRYEKIGYYNWRDMELINTIEGQLNEQGEYKFSYEVNESKDADFTYIFSADVVDESRRTVSGNATALITRGSFGLFTSPEQYFIEKGKPVKIRVNAADFSNKPVQAEFNVVFTYPDEHHRPFGQYTPYKDSLTGKTDEQGKAEVIYVPKFNASGYFNYTVYAKDEKGRLITAMGSFYYGDKSYYGYSWGQGVEIITDKDTYKKGDSLTAYIFLPDTSTEFLLTYEANEVFYYKKEFAQQNSITIKEKLGDRFAPSFNIAVTYMKNDKFYNQSKSVGVLAEDKFLKLSIAPDKKIYKPSDSASFTIMVKDFFGKPVPKTDLSIGIVDEAIYSIQEETVPDITSFFYAPVYSWVPTNNSYFYNYSYGQSRQVNALDKYFFDRNKKYEKGNGNLSGKAMNTPSQSLSGCEIVLLNADNFYSTMVDTGGKYKFSNIVKGKYDIWVYGNEGVIFTAKDIEVGKDSKYDILISSIDVTEVRGGSPSFIEDKMAAPKTSANKIMSSEQKGVQFTPAVTRSNFVDAAFWAPSLITDDEGKVTARFKMPDNLTKWRTTVKGINASSLVAQDTLKTITRKDLLVRMETPRFFREGDELTISTIVHNYLDQKKRTKITFRSDKLKLIDSQINSPGYSTNLYNEKDGMYELTIDKNAELRIDWRVKVTSAVDTAKLFAEALTDKESDAIELKVPVLPKGLKRVIPVTAEMDNKSEEVLTFDIPGGTDLRTAQFSFNTAPSLSGTMLKALDELAGYPYGCVEQTMSRFLPTIIVTKAFKELNLPFKSQTVEELPKMVAEGLKKLYGFQLPDNGWGWWANDKSSPYMTAYVVYGLNQCKEAGYRLNESVLQRGIDRLAAQFQESGLDETTVAYMIYSLSSASKDKYHDLIIKKIAELNKEKLNPYSLSLITLALLNLQDKKQADEWALYLAGKANLDNGFTAWNRISNWDYCWHNDDVQTTAYALKALINAGVKKELVPNGVKWLLLQRKGFYWRSTQETAAIIFMLTDYLKQTNELNPDYNVKVYVNGQMAFEKNMSSKDVYTDPQLIKLASNLKTGSNEIRIVKNGSGKIYFSGINEYYTKDTEQSGKDAKFSVTREFYLLKPSQREGRIIYTKDYFNGKVKSGDDILVKTRVTTSIHNPQYFMLEDMLPSGIEVVKDMKKYEIEGENDYRYHDYWDYRPWRWFYSNREYRDEKVAFFVTSGNQQMEFTYIIKAQIPGDYNIMPSQASLMYYPEINGNSGSEELVIRDK